MGFRRMCSLLLLLSAAGCGDDARIDDGGGAQDGGADDAGADAGGEDMGLSCAANSDCDDGLFCNGLERCDDHRCLTGEPRTCDDGVDCTTDRCDESTLSCVHSGPDEDGDGAVDARCLGQGGVPLGTDCDDADENRYPGNAEVCDGEGHDEDCDLTTFGLVDEDGDGANDAACCNLNSEGTPLCGSDCNDDDAGISPTSPEVCNDVDDDCDGSIDEGLPLVAWSPDCDGDGVGDETEAIVLDCARPADQATCNILMGEWVAMRGDCDELDIDRNPTVIEVCNRVDDDCDGSIDEGLPQTAWTPDCDGDGFGDASATPVLNCATPEEAAMCDTLSGNWVALNGDCDETDGGRNPGAPETCNFKDDDCDNLVDDITPGAVICYAGQTRSCTNVCGEPGVETCSANCLGFDACIADEACNGCDDDGDGARDDGFTCPVGDSENCTTQCGTSGTRVCGNDCEWAQCVTGEACNYCDDDGDGSLLDERAEATNFTLDSPIQCGGANVTTFGPAACDVQPGTCCNRTEFYATLLDGMAVDQSGAYWFDTGVYTGWGRVRAEVEVQVRLAQDGTPYGGWSLMIADANSTFGATTAGVQGIRLDWYWQSEALTGAASGFPPATGDAFRMRGDGGTPLGPNDQGSDTVMQGQSISNTAAHLDLGDTGSWISQTVVIDYTPDDPATFPNEEVIGVNVAGGTYSYEVDSLIWTTDPDHELSLHIPLVIGIVAWSQTRHYDVGPPEGIDIGTQIEARAHLQTMTPPSGPGAPTFDNHTNYSRWDHCPGL